MIASIVDVYLRLVAAVKEREGRAGMRGKDGTWCLRRRNCSVLEDREVTDPGSAANVVHAVFVFDLQRALKADLGNVVEGSIVWDF